MRIAALLVAFTLCLAGCGDFPRDARGTLDRLRAGEPLRVGYTVAEPWVRATASGGGEPTGIEADLVRAFAQTIPTRIEWIAVSEAQGVEALKAGAIQLAIAGFTADSPWGASIGQTQPYLEAKVVIGLAPGTAAPAYWRDAEVRYNSRRPHFAAVIEAVGAKPVAAEGGGLTAIGAAYAEEIPNLGLTATGTVLGTERRVIATPAAENALTFALDRFLHTQKRLIADRLASGARS